MTWTQVALAAASGVAGGLIGMTIGMTIGRAWAWLRGDR